MSDRRKSWVMYDSFLEVADMMPNPKERDQMILAIVHMGFYDEIPEGLPLYMQTALKQMMESVRGAKSRHDAAVENGRKGGKAGTGDSKRRFGNKNASKRNPNDNVNVNVNVNDNYIMTTPIDLLEGQGSSNYMNADEMLNEWRQVNE